MVENNDQPIEESYQEHKQNIEKEVAESKERESNQGINKRVTALEKLKAKLSKQEAQQKPIQQTKAQRRASFLERMQRRKGIHQGIKKLTNSVMPSKSFIDSRRPASLPLPSSRAQTLQINNRDKTSAMQRFNEIKQRRLMEANLKNNQISQNTQQMLSRLADIQNKGKTDDMNQQRILAEKRIVSQAGNLLATPNIFREDPNRLNSWLETEGNPIRAPNVFAERPDTPHITVTGRPNILQTREAGNNLNLLGSFNGQPNQQTTNKPADDKPIRLNFWKS